MNLVLKAAILGICFTYFGAALAAPKKTSPPKPPSRTGDAKVYYLSDHDVATLVVHPGGSVLSFPTKPTKVVIGRENQFDVQYVERDVAIVSLSPSASASMFVYLLGRRYSFNLVASATRGERIVVVRDPGDDQVYIEVK